MISESLEDAIVFYEFWKDIPPFTNSKRVKAFFFQTLEDRDRISTYQLNWCRFYIKSSNVSSDRNLARQTIYISSTYR